MKNCLIIIGVLIFLFFIFSDTRKDSAPVSLQEGAVKNETFKGYECTGDCSGHNAGYEWARKKGITDPDECSGNSNSFIEGCKSYASE